MKFLNNPTNNLLKTIRALKIKNLNAKSNLFIAEGKKICIDALTEDLEISYIFIPFNCSDEIIALANEYQKKKISVYQVEKREYERLCDTNSPQEILAVITKIKFAPNYNIPFIAIDGISDPGNLGSIIRSSDWFGYKQIFVEKNSVNPYSPKVVRSSMGSVFRTAVIEVDNLPSYLKNNFKETNFFGADLKSTKLIDEYKITKNFGLIFGNESHGLSNNMREIIDSPYLIQKTGKAESLNLGVSVGISLYYFSKYL